MTKPRPDSNEAIFSDELNELLKDYVLCEGPDELKEALRNQIVERVLPYVRRISYGLARRSADPVDDLVQVGTIGLMKAVQKYNPLAGSSFKTYATYFITGEIRHYLRDKATMIKAPRQMYELYYRINQIVQQLSERYGRTPSDLEIAEELQCSVAEVSQAQSVDRRRSPISLDQFSVRDEEGDSGYVEKLVDENDIVTSGLQESRLLIQQALEQLKPEHRSVVEMTYYKDMSQTEIAGELGISQMQVSRRLRKALEILFELLQEPAFADR